MKGDYKGLLGSNLTNVDAKMDVSSVAADTPLINDFFDKLWPRYKDYVQ